MKYKVFAYIGSFRGSNSITERVMYSLLENLSETYGIEFNNSIYTAKNSDIHECVGCLNCFNAGVCSLHDDMNDIKEAIKIAILSFLVHLCIFIKFQEVQKN